MKNRAGVNASAWLAIAALLASTLAHGAEATATAGATSAVSAQLQEIVVTGSRIRVQVGSETVPVMVLDSKDLARGGLDSLAKILQAIPMSAASVANTNINNGGDGSARLDLRALRPKRTLVLLNGHRFPNGGIGGDDSVDIDSLPVSLIERVEVLTSGASAIYGADAVAGVVNFITRKSLSGVEFGGEQLQTDRADGGVSSATLSAGGEIFGGQWMLGGDFVRQREVSQDAREFSALPQTIVDPSGRRITYGSRVTPEGVFRVGAGNILDLPRDLYTRVSGNRGSAAANFRPASFPADRFNFTPFQYLQTPNQRSTLWLFGSQPLNEHLSLHIEELWQHRTSSQKLAPSPFQSTLDLAPLLADGEFGIPANNFYNPFGVDLTDVRRRFVEISNRGFRQAVNRNRTLLALHGEKGSWNLDFAVAWAKSGATRSELGSIPGQRLATAIGPSGRDGAGRIVCGVPDATTGIVPTAAIISGCVPIDLFGGVGSIDATQRAYLTLPLQDHGANSQRTVSTGAEGSWGHAPGGAIAWALGAEYRREGGSFRFDPERGGGAVGSGGEVDLPPVSFTARELYLEARAPLMRDHAFARALDATASVRWSDFSSFGRHFTWQGGLRWQPVTAWALRGNYARVFRAPNLQELYTRQGRLESEGIDPCGNSPAPTQLVHCAANGVPGGQYSQPDFDFFPALQGGNPDLAPESGASIDVGVELHRPELADLRATLDFYRINLDGFVATPTADDILAGCADRGTAAVCSLIGRNSAGNIISMTLIPRNFGRSLASGIDAAVALSSNQRIGRISFAVQASYLAQHETQPFIGGATVREAGTYSPYASALPRWRSLLHIDIDRGAWHGSYSAQWLGGYNECTALSDVLYCRRVGGVLYHDLEGSLELASSTTLRLGVSNLTNIQPPFLAFGNDANTDSSTYRLLGRTIFVALQFSSP